MCSSTFPFSQKSFLLKAKIPKWKVLIALNSRKFLLIELVTFAKELYNEMLDSKKIHFGLQ